MHTLSLAKPTRSASATTAAPRAFAATLALIALLAALVSFAAPLAAAQSPDDEPRINLLHGIPGFSVDVYSDGDILVENFQFGDVKDLSALAGETLFELEVNAAGTNQVIIDAGDVELTSTGNFSIVAHLDEVGEPTLAVFANKTDEIAPGNGRLTVRHVAATDSVDVLVDGEVQETGLTNGQEITADLDINTYEIEVKSGPETVIGPAPVMVREGRSLIVYAVGSNNDQLTTITDTYEVTENAPSPIPTPTLAASPDNSSGPSTSSGSTDSGSGGTTMTETIDNLSGSPAGVETGIGAITVTEFSPTRTLIAVALALFAITGGFVGLRRFSNTRN